MFYNIQMSARLSKQERETIIIDYLKGKPIPGYEVNECANGKFRVKQKHIEIEEEEDCNDTNEIVKVESEKTPKATRASLAIEKPKTNKLNARKLLQKLSNLIDEDEDEDSDDVDNSYNDNSNTLSYNTIPQKPIKTWGRRKLRF